MIEVVGIGPGDQGGRTFEAQRSLEDCEVLVGYSAYLDLVRAEFPSKQLVQTGMRAERERCEAALQISREGKRVAMVCSGDAGVYGMAALLMELAQDGDEIRVVPGVTAALSASALLGAPISGDFVCISLSDLLTPWEVIEHRLIAACEGDFVIALYNPRSHGRPDHLRKACGILARYRSGATPCGWARNIGRAGASTNVLTLAELAVDERVDMFTTVVIGNSQTVASQGRLVTPRGYAL